MVPIAMDVTLTPNMSFGPDTNIVQAYLVYAHNLNR